MHISSRYAASSSGVLGSLGFNKSHGLTSSDIISLNSNILSIHQKPTNQQVVHLLRYITYDHYILYNLYLDIENDLFLCVYMGVGGLYFRLDLSRRILISNNDIICFMSAQDWAGFILTVVSIIGVVGVGVRWIVKKYVEDILSELKPNSGSSMKDQITRLETKMDRVFDMMITHLEDHSKK